MSRSAELPTPPGADSRPAGLGHSTVAFTLDNYSHAIPEMDESAAETFSEFMRGPVVKEVTGLT